MNSNKADFWSVLIGSNGAGFFLGYIVIASICAGAIILYDIGTRDPESKRSPERFSLRFWLADNLARVLANTLFIPIAIRVICEFVTNPSLMLFLSAGVGFGIDYLGMVAKRAGILTTRKLASKVTETLKMEEDEQSGT